MGVTRRTLWHTGVYGAGLVLNRGITLLLIPLYTRVLAGTEEYAVFELSATTILFLVPLIELGMATGVLRFFHLYDSPDKQRRMFGTSVIFVAAASLIGIGLAVVAARPLSQLVFGVPDLGFLIILVAIEAAVTAVGNQPLALMRARERSTAFALVCLIRAVTGPIIIVWFVVYLRMGVVGILWGNIIGLALMAATGFIANWRWIDFRFDPKILKPMLAFSLPLAPALLATLITTMSDRYLVRHWLGVEPLAVYSLGVRVATIITFITRAFQTAWPASAFDIAKRSDAPQLLARMLRYVALGMSLMVLGLSAAAPEVVRIFGPVGSYAGAHVIVPWIALSYAMHAVTMFITTNLAIARKTIHSSAAVCLGAVAKIVFAVYAIQAWGILGAALSTVAALAVEMALAQVISHRFYPIPIETRKLAALAVVMLAACAALAWAGGLTPLGLSLLIRLVTLGLTAGLLLAFGVVSKSELIRFWNGLRRRAPERKPA